jgi:hypothetical protein
MPNFFVSPYEPKDRNPAKSDLIIDVNWYRERLREKWPDIRFFVASPDLMALQWEFGEGIGSLDKYLQIVSLDGPYEEYFYWHRQVITEQYRLFLFNETSWASLELTYKTTLEDIIRFNRTNP